MAKKLTSAKAKKILHDKSVHGQPLTDKQRKFFGAIAGGAKPYKAQNGIEGTMGGLTDIGFNYNGAWGGTMQDGGLTFLEPTSKKLPKGYVIPYNTPSTELAISIGGEGGEPAYLIPSFKYGKYLTDKDAKAEFRKTGEHLGGPFKTWQEADEWERTVRHPYVEKGQSIPTPLKRWGKDFAMGGSLPGAVGFMYTRTQGAAPSNGPYAKKTKASAQDGASMRYYQEGLDFKPKTISQDGSEISIDPMGYWNPENWGNPVIIPSTDITMEGVDQDLIGVSDTGDIQYLEANDPKIKKFDGDYVTEYPMAAQGVSVNKADEAPLKKLDQLLNFTNYNDMAKAKQGKKLPKAHDGLNKYRQSIPQQYQLTPYGGYSGSALNNATYNKQTGMFNSGSGQISMADTQALGFNMSGNKTLNRTLQDLDANKIQSGFQATSTIGKNVQKVSQAIEQKKQAKQLSALAPIIKQAADIRPEEIKRRYDRDIVGMSGGYGVGTNFLAENGMQIGGNLTEIQNMYNPGDLYSNLGYEPLDDSSKMKNYKKGGNIYKAQDGGTMEMINEGINLGGDIVAGIIDLGTKRLNKQSQNLLQQAGFQSGMQNIQQNQYGAYMENGGGLKYLSNDWQPQVIAKFGDYDLKDLLAPPKDADMLRAGGEVRDIRSNYMGDDEKLSMMQMGGELQTYWGGDAETISENPYLPGGGETIMFRGQSHEESDGQGRTGIGITFGQNPVEVERGEPATKLRDGGTGEDSLVVFGNMKIPSYGVSELEDAKAKGKKFKHYAADLSKVENKANKTSDKALEIIDDVDGDSPFDILKLNTGKAMLQGADATLKEAAYKKNILAGIQSAILDTAGELGLESDALAKGKIKKAKDSDMAKFGAKMETAQVGITQPLTPILPVNTYYRIDPRNTGLQTSEAVKKVMEEAQKPKAPVTKATAKANAVKKSVPKKPEYVETKRESVGPVKIAPVRDVDTSYPIKINERFLKENPPPAVKTSIKSTDSKFEWEDLYNQLYPYIRPGVRNPLDPGQLAGEMFALATNQLEPVQAQTYKPLLEDVTSISLQDQLNEIQAQTNAAMRLTGNNPAAQAVIASQAAAAKNKVLGEQLRINQQLGIETKRRNLEALNKASLLNLEIFDKQYERQAKAKSATKAQAFEALSSIAEKIGKNKAETLQANVMANMYPQFTYGPKGRIYSTGMAKFNIPTIAKSGKKIKPNGSIVKAIKNL